MTLEEMLTAVVKQKASDLHLQAGMPPMVRVSGELLPLGSVKLSAEDTANIAGALLDEDKRAELAKKRQVDSAYDLGKVARFRVNIYHERGQLRIVMRTIPYEIPKFSGLNLPPIIKDIVMREVRGLVLVTGTAGSGKSTALASMLDLINATRPCHIVTIEDPIEFIYTNKKAIISQREVGLDALDFADALRNVLRQDPDVVLMGEMRDTESVSVAITAAETGHLVFSTLHTVDAVQTINRVIDFFPPQQQDQIRFQLANTLKAVISLRLLKRATGEGRIPGAEIMVATQTIATMIRENNTKGIREQMESGAEQYGMQTFDQSLIALCRNGFISKEQALQEATRPADVELRMKGITRSVEQAKSVMLGSAIVDDKEGAVKKHLNQGMRLFAAHNYQAAMAEFQDVLRISPTNTLAREKIAEIEREVSRQAQNGDLSALIERGIGFYRNGNFEGAIAVWKEALAKDPKNQQAQALIKEAETRLH